MSGKYDFPEVLPSPPSPSSGDTLLGPTRFLLSTDSAESSGAFYGFNSNFSDFDTTRVNCNDISKESVALNSQQPSQATKCKDSKVGRLQEANGGGQQHVHHNNRDGKPLFYVPEIVNGKEVVTLTTSCHTPTHNTSSTSFSKMGVNCDLATYVENTNCVPEDAMNINKGNANTLNYDICADVPVSVQDNVFLLTPENFASTLSRSSTGTSSLVDLESILPELPTRLEACIKESVRKVRCTHTQGDVMALTPKTVQTSSETTEGKNTSTKAIITPNKFAHATYSPRGVTKEEGGRSGVVRSLYSYYSNNGTESELMSESEEELEELEEEDERKEEERQSKQQAASLYDNGRLPPIGVFWDIENCQVPKGLSATHVVQAIRARFFNDHREAEFMCVCDTLKELSKILEELNDAQVNVVHIGSTVKNAADDKLLQSMRRFADIHGPGATIILISGDSNFATELYDLRYRKNLRVILVHNAHAQDSLKLCAHETALFSEVTQQLPQRTLKPKGNTVRRPRDIVVKNLPDGMDESAVRRRLSMLSANCGGKVGRIRNNSATISFQTPELAARAKKRLDGEDVYGSRILCNFGSVKNFEKEGSPRVDNTGKFSQFPRDREDFSESVKTGVTQCFQNFPTAAMGEVGTGTLSSWRVKESVVDPGAPHQHTSAFKSYGKCGPVTSQPGDQFASPRPWRNTGCRTLSQSNVNTCGGTRVLSQDYSLQNDVQFRMSSPPTSSFPLRTPDSYSFDSTINSRLRSPSPQMLGGVGGLNNTWNSPTTIADLQGQVVYSLRDLTVSDPSSTDSVLGGLAQMPVELHITNLDQNIDARELKRILFTVFRDHVMVLHVSVFVQSDGNLAATLRVPSPQDAQYAISQLHRRKIGTKRIIISYVNHNQPSPELKRSKVVALLQEVPRKKLPLFTFRELYENRYHETIGVSDLYSMRDYVTVSDNSTGRMLSLHPQLRHIHSPVPTEYTEEEDGSNMSRYCKVHCSGPDKSVGWAEREQDSSLPNVNLTLRVLAGSIHSLLQSHSGSLPLASLPDCYQAEVGPLQEYEEGVPLEHLVSCLPGVCILTAATGYKTIIWKENKITDEAEELARCVSPPLISQLALFSRELVDLLKTFPSCHLLFARFIPAYHHHFGRQCRVADYGFTKLADLFDALPHIIQVLGEGTKRMLTLAHRAQVKRFSSDLLRVLKNQPAKAITLETFPSAYEKTITRPWNITDYGVCDIEDMLAEVGETTVIVNRLGRETTIAIPKREQTPDEIERTRQFATEVVELLRHSPQCKMQFNRFIPAYHHHFGRQCKVADYGFSKLIELFEAIPDILQVFDDEEDGEKQLQLAERERVRVLGEQVGAVVRGAPHQAIKISALTQVFTHYYGYSLKASQYGCQSLEQLMAKLRNHVKLVETGGEPLVTLVDRGYVHEVMVRVRRVLWDIPTCSAPLDKFINTYIQCFNHPPNLEIIKRDLEEVVVIVEGEGETGQINLVPLQVFARDLLTLLQQAGGRMLLLSFDKAYLDRYGVPCRPARYGFPNLVALVQALGDMVSVMGRGTKRVMVLNRAAVPSLPLFNDIPSDNSSVYVEDGGVTEVEPPPASQLPQPNKVTSPPPPPPPPQCDYQHLIQETGSNGHLVVSVNPPVSHQSFQSTSPVVYPGSPAPTGGSVIWGQVWSPQYPVMPPLSPAHYMVPTIPMNWGSMPASSPVGQVSSNSSPGPYPSNMTSPISIHTLDELAKQECSNKIDEELNAPPSANELPSPELLTQMAAAPQMVPDTTTSYTDPQNQAGVEGEGSSNDVWSNSSKGEAATAPPSAPKLHPKRRIAAQFTSS
ncbi:hypothetical protein Pcinc_019252 [Petrolisthes cinctipes]|uniref:Meiosis regulator and mRNA stability factor 1 n=1 Tax=Petrolisthes cinctipes TaxID=88211 RepID=A0AAE1FLL2_PETCI|nr:hypothetical protein Pcinc_019252 [Petrolisthes cinctipes]